MEPIAFDERRVRIGRRRLLVSAPAGDPFLAGLGTKTLAAFETLCRHALAPEAVMIDVGANIGLTALVAAPILERGRIVAVEASPRNCAALKANVARHGATNVEILSSAVGAGAGTAVFHDASAYGHVVTGGNIAGFAGEPQPIVTIDGIVTERALQRLDFIKIDVEGFEQDVLQGAEAMLAQFDPLVLLEFNSWCMIAWFDRSPRQFLDWLLARFPQLYLWRDGRLTDLRAVGPLEFLRRHLTGHGANDDLVAAGTRLDLAALASRLEHAPRIRLPGSMRRWLPKR